MSSLGCSYVQPRMSPWTLPDSGGGGAGTMTSSGRHTSHGHQGDPLTSDPARVTLHLIADTHEVYPLIDLYQPVLDWVDPNLHLFRVTEHAHTAATDVTSGSRCREHSVTRDGSSGQPNDQCPDLPAIAVMVFLRTPDTASSELGQDGLRERERLESARNLFRYRPWKFHHSEKLGQGKINAVPGASREFFYTSRDLPLWALRHVHYGREHVRYVLYTTEDSWPDQVHFYRLILGIEPDLLRDDFCLFTLHAQPEYDVQFALKRVEPGTQVLRLDSVHIQVKVKDIGQLVPLFPNVCRPVSDVTWQTTDHEGNTVVLDVVRTPLGPGLGSQKTKSSVSRRNSAPPTNAVRKREGLQSQTSDQSAYQNQTSDQSAYQNLTSDQSALYQNIAAAPTSKNGIYRNFPVSEDRNYRIRPVLSDGGDIRDINRLSTAESVVFDTHSGDVSADDFDLPHVTSSRMNVTPEEDEESLTLTNTSEESGIQVHQGSDDLSFCEDEPLKPCLHKVRASRIRAVKFRVRFKEEVEAFEDDVFSRLSSGIDSEDQSDDEMATSFRYIPQSTTPSSLGDSNPPPPSSTAVGPTDWTTCPPNGQENGVGSSDHLGQGAVMDRLTHQPKNPLEGSGSRLMTVSGTIGGQSSTTGQPPSSPRPPPTQKENQDPPPPPYVPPPHRRAPNSSSPLSSDNVNCATPRPLHPPPYSHRHSSTPSPGIPIGKAPPSYDSIRSSRSFSSPSPLPSPADSGRLSHPQYSSTNGNSPRPPSSCSITSPGPAALPARPESRQSQYVTGPCLKTLDQNLNPSPSPSPSPRQQTVSGVKSVDRPSRKDANSSCGQEETPLKFTLKFDTCPTSGLKSREEQIGFYV
ncbi:formin-like protein 5 [Aplysia californica]|uniref:Formin-like protein 5 n=1 Tax=Aplysia californica TaxID=6500 RepID=A0ABM0K544_APLCA|nr:formin-like protein 5 [Aplysia californica]